MIAADTETLLGILKWALLALLYLFFARVLWAVWSEVRGPRPQRGRPAQVQAVNAAGRSTIAPTDPTIAAPAPVGTAMPAPRAVKGKKGNVARLVVTQPKARRGSAWGIGEEITIGRAGTCTISMPDDTFVSQLHARVYLRDMGAWVEDLGSTNGTYLNGKKLAGPVQLVKGDRVQIGATILEAE